MKQALTAIGSALDDRTTAPVTAEGLEAFTELGFVGRERELAALRAAADAAISGRGSIVAVAGEPGIGKTRMVSEVGLVRRPAGSEGRLGALSGRPRAPRPTGRGCR